MFRRWILPRLVWLVFRLLKSTWRMTTFVPPGLAEAVARGDRLIFAHWHGDELCIIPLVTPYRIATMTSTSADGALIDFVIRRLGGATSRGSSTRGGIGALKGLVRLMGQGFRASMAVDGPKGPIYRVKPGVFELSRLAGARIVPMGAACSNPHVFERSWNKAKLPKPFSRIHVVFGEPWVAFDRALSPRDPQHAERLAAEITGACQAAALALPYRRTLIDTREAQPEQT